MPVTPRQLSGNKKPSQQAVEAEEELARLEAEAMQQVKDSETPAEGEEETPEPESAPGEETSHQEETPEEPTEPSQSEEEPEEDLTDEEAQRLSAKAQKRLRTLAEKAKRAEELEREIAELKSKLGGADESEEETPSDEDAPESELDAELEALETDLDDESQTGRKGSTEGTLPWEQTDEDGEPRELTEEELDKRIDARAKQIAKEDREKRYNLLLSRRLQNDVKAVEQKYDVLREGSDSYDKALAMQLADDFKKIFVADKRERFFTFVQRRMSLLEKGIQLGKNQAKSTLSQQNAEQPLTPSSTPARRTNVLDAIQGADTIEALEKLEGSIS